MYPLTQNVRHISVILKRNQGKKYSKWKITLV